MNIKNWTEALQKAVSRAGVRCSGVSVSKSQIGMLTAYFAVPGIGEIRVSEFKIRSENLSSHISISKPKTYIDLVKAYAFAHNKHHPIKLVIVDCHPYLVREAQVSFLEQEMQRKRELKETGIRQRQMDDARNAWWKMAVNSSNIEGSFKEVKFALKSMGVRCPHPAIDGRMQDYDDEVTEEDIAALNAYVESKFGPKPDIELVSGTAW